MKSLSDEDILTQKEIDAVDKEGVMWGDIVPYLQTQVVKTRIDTVRQIVELLEKWREQGTHLVSNEAIEELKELVK